MIYLAVALDLRICRFSYEKQFNIQHNFLFFYDKLHMLAILLLWPVLCDCGNNEIEIQHREEHGRQIEGHNHLASVFPSPDCSVSSDILPREREGRRKSSGEKFGNPVVQIHRHHFLFMVISQEKSE